ncbi:hypothetical protein QZM35_00785 [Burkholderia sp. AU45274]|uniref:hypothetical protein n=1 Tax=Burkholderia sp. AU45274 TaxID=3059205 RepID=UPI00264ADB81|nr:hypothetical protein [Burkholderia sp. AU45274]MDN7486217.1 hypothetical protein [Burkholderia sp. AU45274]
MIVHDDGCCYALVRRRPADHGTGTVIVARGLTFCRRLRRTDIDVERLLVDHTLIQIEIAEESAARRLSLASIRLTDTSGSLDAPSSVEANGYSSESQSVDVSSGSPVNVHGPVTAPYICQEDECNINKGHITIVSLF